MKLSICLKASVQGCLNKSWRFAPLFRPHRHSAFSGLELLRLHGTIIHLNPAAAVLCSLGFQKKVLVLEAALPIPEITNFLPGWQHYNSRGDGKMNKDAIIYALVTQLLFIKASICSHFPPAPP